MIVSVVLLLPITMLIVELMLPSARSFACVHGSPEVLYLTNQKLRFSRGWPSPGLALGFELELGMSCSELMLILLDGRGYEFSRTRITLSWLELS
jgi:hypothetical protein